jgi:hypothetical protein
VLAVYFKRNCFVNKSLSIFLLVLIIDGNVLFAMQQKSPGRTPSPLQIERTHSAPLDYTHVAVPRPMTPSERSIVPLEQEIQIRVAYKSLLQAFNDMQKKFTKEKEVVLASLLDTAKEKEVVLASLLDTADDASRFSQDARNKGFLEYAAWSTELKRRINLYIKSIFPPTPPQERANKQNQ